MSSDSQALLEFEESLAASNASGTVLLERNLSRKLDSARRDRANSDTESMYQEIDNDSIDFTHDEIIRLYQQYSFANDELHSCNECGRSLCDADYYQQCCVRYTEISMAGQNRLASAFWVAFICNPTQVMVEFPWCTQFWCLEQGIPSQLRSRVWESLVLAGCSVVPETSKLIYGSFQHSYLPEIAAQITKDVSRTFPGITFFENDNVRSSLSTILNVYANYDAALGYCQGLVFLTGILYYHLHHDPCLTLHALILIMNSETQVRALFVPDTMQCTLTQWHRQFTSVLQHADPVLATHMNSFVSFPVFLFQWWMSFMVSHAPDPAIPSRVFDLCLLHGWKVGLFKVSLGLLIANRSLLLALGPGDEEVVYQHLLNESKWGPVAASGLDQFFGSLLSQYDQHVAANVDSQDIDQADAESVSVSPLPSPSKNANFFSRLRQNPFTWRPDPLPVSGDESQSLFSRACALTLTLDTESVFSVTTEYSSGTELEPSPMKSHIHGIAKGTDQLEMRVDYLEQLLREAYNMLGNVDESVALRETIAKTLHC